MLTQLLYLLRAPVPGGVGRDLVRSPGISRSRRAATAHNPYDGAPGRSEPYAVPGGWSVSRVFLSHSSRDSRQAMAVKAWLIEQEPGLADEIYLDLDPHTGIRPGERWKQALQQANARCEAVICLLSKHWLNLRANARPSSATPRT